MPIEMGDKTFDKFEDASKSVQSSKGLPEDRANAYVATIDRKQNEVDPNLLTPKKQETEPITLQSTQGEVSPDSEIKTNDEYGKLNGDTYAKNEDEVKDEKREEQQGQATEQDEDEKWNFEKPKEADEQEQETVGASDDMKYKKQELDKTEDVQGDTKFDYQKGQEQEDDGQLVQAQQDKEDAYGRVNEEPSESGPSEGEDEVEYEGENYKLLKISESALRGNLIEYNNKFYTPLKLKEKISEADIDYEGTVYRPRTNSLIEYGGKIYQKEAENPHTDTDPDQDQAGRGTSNNEQDQARPLELPAEEEVSVSGPPAGTEPTVIEDELKKTGENIVVKTRKGYRRLQVYEADTTTSKLENLKNRGLSKKEKDKESKKKA